MQIKIQRARLLEGLKKVQGTSNAKASLPILANVKIEAKDGAIALTTSNLDNTLYAVVDGVEVVEAGATSIPFGLLMRSITALPDGEVSITTDAKEASTIVCGSARYKIVGLPAAEFPPLPEDANAQKFKVSAKAVKELIRKTAYAQSVDDTRRSLKSILFNFSDPGVLTCAATDGRRLATAQTVYDDSMVGKDGDPKWRYIVPSSAISAIQKILPADGDVEFSLSVSQLLLSMEDGKMKAYAKLMDSDYPNYASVIPTVHKVEAVVDRQMLISAINRVSVLAEDNTAATFTFGNGNLKVEVKGVNDGVARDEIAVKYNGDPLEIKFNPKYLVDPLNATDSDAIVIELNTPQTPAVFKAETETWLSVLMPLRIQN